MKKKNNPVMILSFLLVGALLLAGCGQTADSLPPSETETAAQYTEPTEPSATATVSQTQSESGGMSETRSVTVNSSETVSVVPDMAEVVYSVRTERNTAADCQQQNAAAVTQVTELLKSLGVAERSIRTSDFSMRPVYDYSGNTARITGYAAETCLTVSDLKIDSLGDILSQSVASGINTVQSITYQAGEYDRSYQEALTKAVDMARQKAETLATASGARVGKVIGIQETGGYTQARYEDSSSINALNARKEMSLGDTEDELTQIMPGEIAVKASVTVEYELTD